MRCEEAGERTKEKTYEKMKEHDNMTLYLVVIRVVLHWFVIYFSPMSLNLGF